MNELLNELTPYLMGVLTILAGYAATKLKAYIDSKVDADQQTRIYNFVRSTVAYVEQISNQDFTSQEKYELAKEKVLLWANEKGITISEAELEILIESFVNGLGGSK